MIFALLPNLNQILSSENGITKSEATNNVTILFEEMASSLEKGDWFEIRGLCTFLSKAMNFSY